MTEVVIYESTAGSVEVRLERETVWLRQEQLAELFGRDRTVIGRHIRNVFKEGELDEATNVQNMHIPSSDKPVRRYSLDVIISVGYRIKSHEGVRFRQWANRVLREHLRQGYTINRDRFEANARELEAALELVRKAGADRPRRGHRVVRPRAWRKPGIPARESGPDRLRGARLSERRKQGSASALLRGEEPSVYGREQAQRRLPHGGFPQPEQPADG